MPDSVAEFIDEFHWVDELVDEVAWIVVEPKRGMMVNGVKRSVSCVSDTLTAAGERAAAYNLEIRVPLRILGEADEIFQGGSRASRW